MIARRVGFTKKSNSTTIVLAVVISFRVADSALSDLEFILQNRQHGCAVTI